MLNPKRRVLEVGGQARIRPVRRSRARAPGRGPGMTGRPRFRASLWLWTFIGGLLLAAYLLAVLSFVLS